MEVGKDFLDVAAKRSFARLEESKRWWKSIPEEERKSAYEAWLAANPDDFRATWGYKLASISKNSIEAVWEHANAQQNQTKQ